MIGRPGDEQTNNCSMIFAIRYLTALETQRSARECRASPFRGCCWGIRVAYANALTCYYMHYGY